MKKTLELEDDIAAKLDTLAQATGLSLDKVLNEAVREGLTKVGQKLPVKAKPFCQKTHKMGVYAHIDYSKTSALLDELDGSDFLESAGRRK